MDARVRYTQRAIKETFLGLLAEQPLAKITVTAICQGADINRATFYKYYDNPIDLMQKLENELLDNLQDRLMAQPDKTIESVAEIVLNHLYEEQEVYRVMFSQNGDTTLMERVLDACYQENMAIIMDLFPEMREREQNWLFYFVGEGCNGIVRHWISDGMKRDEIREMVQFAGQIVETINAHFKDDAMKKFRRMKK